MHTTDHSALYQKLKRNQIRVVRINHENDQLSGTLETVTLPPADGRMMLISKIHKQLQEEWKPEKRWSALSYVWGDATCTKEFTLNGVKILIHLNLYHALRDWFSYNAKQQLETYPIWTDYICINQADSEERKRHIHSMDQIYQNAYCVYSYFGESNEYTESAVDFLSKLRPIIESGIEDLLKRYREDGIQRSFVDGPLVGEHLPPVEQRPGVAREVYNIFCNTYFDRKWILQENVLARSQNILRGSVGIDAEMLFDYCSHISWRQVILTALDENVFRDISIEKFGFNPWPFVRAICSPVDEEAAAPVRTRWSERQMWIKQPISQLLNTLPRLATKFSERLRRRDSSWYAEDPANPAYDLFENLLCLSFELECTMPEDRCLSLVGLLKWGARRKIGRSSHLLEKLPESLDPKSVYLAFATTMLQGQSPFVVFSWAIYSGHQASFGLPTWCPNFNCMMGYLLSNSYRPSVGIATPFSRRDGSQRKLPRILYNQSAQSLTCHGVRIDEVKRCMRTTWKRAGGEEIGSIGTMQEKKLSEAKSKEAIHFLHEVWDCFQEAVRLSPRVREPYRSKILNCSMQAAGMSFLSCMLRLEQEPELVEGMNVNSLLVYLEKLTTFAEQPDISIHNILSNEKAEADSMVNRLGLLDSQYFFVTQSGYFGSGTAEVQPGDVVVMFAGAEYHFILRRAEVVSGDEPWFLMAEAYISELTSGGTYINELNPSSFWPDTFRKERISPAVEPDVEEEEVRKDENEEETGRRKAVEEAHRAKEQTYEETRKRMEKEYSAPFATPAGIFLRWRADKKLKLDPVTIEGHTFDVSPFEEKNEDFTLI